MVNVYDFLLLIPIWVRLKPATEDKDFKKKKFVFVVSISNRPIFALIEDSQTKILTNAYFGHQRAAKLSHRQLKTFKWAFLVHFWLDWFFFFWRPLLGSINASNQRNLKFVKFCLSDLNLPRIEPWGPSWKFLKKKFLIWKHKMFRYYAQTFFVSTTRVKNVLMNFY